MPAPDALTAAAGRRKTGPGTALLLALLAVGGCAGMEPYNPRNNREEGPEKGVFTGSDSEFVIFRIDGEPESPGESESDDTESKPTNPE